jgi:hypothetical protein
MGPDLNAIIQNLLIFSKPNSHRLFLRVVAILAFTFAFLKGIHC